MYQLVTKTGQEQPPWPAAGERKQAWQEAARMLRTQGPRWMHLQAHVTCTTDFETRNLKAALDWRKLEKINGILRKIFSQLLRSLQNGGEREGNCLN